MASCAIAEAANTPRRPKRGAYWLAIHIADCYWKKNKVSFDKRLKWVHQHEAEIIAFEDNPLRPHRFWDEADKPWMFLAACQEALSRAGSGISLALAGEYGWRLQRLPAFERHGQGYDRRKRNQPCPGRPTRRHVPGSRRPRQHPYPSGSGRRTAYRKMIPAGRSRDSTGTTPGTAQNHTLDVFLQPNRRCKA